jgi:hypothetical protein
LTAAPGGPEQAEIPILSRHVKGSSDLGMFIFALAFGGLGATAHCLYVFTGAIKAGKKPDFGWSRLGWYGPQPPMGAIFGALLYVAIRGGLLAASSGASAVNMFGVAAIAAVGGLSASRAYQRLTGGRPSSSPSPPASDSSAPKISDISPAIIDSSAMPSTLTVTGANLTKASFLVNGSPSQPDRVTPTTATFTLTSRDVVAGHVVVSLLGNVATSATVKVT